MARYGRGYPAPSRQVGPAFRGVNQDVTLGSFGLTWSFPAVTVTSPSVTIPLPTFGLTWSFPPIALPVALSTFALSWSFPSIAAVVPPRPGDQLSGASGEVEWNGSLWGPTTNVRVLLPVEGWLGSPSIDNLNVARPSRHGAWDARKLAQQRIVTLRLQPQAAADPAHVHEFLDPIIAATGLSASEDPLPLVIKGYGEPMLAYGQVIDRPITMDGDYNAGLPTVGVLIACGDPRLYTLLRHGVTVPIGVETALANVGNTETNPLIRLPGPVVDPVLVNQTLDRTLRFAITLTAGQILEIDTDNGTVTQAGVNKMSTLTGSGIVPVQDFVLASGSNTILYTATSGGLPGADILWRDATI